MRAPCAACQGVGERGSSSSPDFPGLWPKVTGRGSMSWQLCQGQLFVLPVELGLTVLLIILYWLCTWGYSAPFLTNPSPIKGFVFWSLYNH